MLSTGNPVLNDRTFEQTARWDELQMAGKQAQTMTIGGTVSKTWLMLAVCVGVAMVAWVFLQQNSGLIMPATFGSAIIGLILAVVIAFKPKLAPVLGVPYAALEGVFVGGISLVYAAWAGSQSGAQSGSTSMLASLDTSIVFQAITLTFGITAGMLIAYTSRLIRVGPTFMKIVIGATVGYVFLIFATFILRMFMGSDTIPYIHQMGALGIGISIFAVGLASLNLLVDFKVIEMGVEQRAPKFMEWVGAFGIIVTLVWLYISLLRLLMILRSSE